MPVIRHVMVLCSKIPSPVISEKFNLQTSRMQRQCNFLTYLYHKCGEVNYVSINTKTFLYATRSELLPSFGHLSFYLVHNKTGFLHHVKMFFGIVSRGEPQA